jgi:hypothetical protein
MFKVVTVANKSWWVPSEHPAALAVQISDPEQYRGAIQDKLDALLAKEGEKAARQQVADSLEPDGRLMFSPGLAGLREDLLGNGLVLQLVASGDPARADPADQEEAEYAVAHQSEVSLGDFLEALPA